MVKRHARSSKDQTMFSKMKNGSWFSIVTSFSFTMFGWISFWRAGEGGTRSQPGGVSAARRWGGGGSQSARWGVAEIALAVVTGIAMRIQQGTPAHDCEQFYFSFSLAGSSRSRKLWTEHAIYRREDGRANPRVGVELVRGREGGGRWLAKARFSSGNFRLASLPPRIRSGDLVHTVHSLGPRTREGRKEEISQRSSSNQKEL